MMEYLPTLVESYSGYRANEKPLNFYINYEKIKIIDIIDRWYEGGQFSERKLFAYFKVLTLDNSTYLLKYDLLNDNWMIKKN